MPAREAQSPRLATAAARAPARARFHQGARERDSGTLSMGATWDFSKLPIHDARPAEDLRVSDPGDAAEQEAERLVSSVLDEERPDTRVRERVDGEVARAPCAECAAGGGSCAGCADEDEEPRVFRSADTARGGAVAGHARSAVQRAVAEPGAPLPTGLRDFFGHRMRASFDHVRVHTGAEAARAARSLSARAFTVGRDVVFGAEEFRPETPSGQRLIAHELVHTIQGGSGLIRRQQVQTPARPPAPARQPAPARRPSRGLMDLPHLDFRPSRHGTPCACVVFIHNEERNARRTAELMHEQCAYNLAIITPDTGVRHISRAVNVAEPARGGRPRRRTLKTDPNELFPRHIAEECMRDPVACQNFVIDTALLGGPRTSRATVDEFILKRFFMAIHDCSDRFTLPVVALHNNSVQDTLGYRTALQGSPQRDRVADELRRLGTDRRGLQPRGPVARRLGERPFGPGTWGQLTGEGGTTNIFRWCTLPEIGGCHVGDPEHPDHVIWTTNADDFEALRRANKNVVLQTSPGRGSESDTDLSTLFLTVSDVIDRRVMDAIVNDLEVSVADLQRALAQLEGVRGDDARARAAEALVRLISGALRYALTAGIQAVRPTRLRFINIETPGRDPAHRTEAQRAAHRAESFQFILGALRDLGLACCRPEEGGEAEIDRRVREPLPPVPR
jgi:hypothetical protein